MMIDLQMNDNKPTYEELFRENEFLKKQLEEKNNLEKELENAQILMQAAFDQSPVPMVVASYPDFAFKIINKATEQFLLLDASKYVNRPPLEVEWNWQEYLPDGSKVTDPSQLPLPLALHGIYTVNKEMRIERHDGTSVWEMANAAPVYDKEGNLIAGIIAMVDITERKRTEQTLDENRIQLKEQNEEYEALNEELRETNEQLLATRNKAEESDRLKTEFLQNMSHEIRTPMNAIMGFSSLLVDNYGNKSKLEHFSGIINQRCSDLLEIINDILEISKIESGQMSVNIEKFDINELLTELSLFFKEYQKRIGKQHLTFCLQSVNEKSFSIIQTDKLKLKQILFNLIGNAFKFTEKGSINCGCTLENNQLIFYVSDTGIGIPHDKQTTIFKRFSQLHHPSIKNLGGTGLGLSIAKGLTDLLGGTLSIESEPEKGTSFFISIPFVESENTNRVEIEKQDKENCNFQNKTVLIVEDDFYNSEYLKEILSKNGLQLIVTENAEKAIQIVAKQCVDLIIMDIRLPNISGYEATRILVKSHPNIKIIAQTAYAAQDERQKALDAGCVDYVSKPTKRELLIAMINKYLLADVN